MGLIEVIIFYLTVAGGVTASFLILMPFLGAVIRFRANYTPKGLQLDGEGGLQPYAGPIINPYFGMLRRVKRLEVSRCEILRMLVQCINSYLDLQGWSGLYKGLSTRYFRALPSTISN